MWAHSMGVQPGKVGHNNTKTPPREPQTQNWKYYFWLGTTRLAESVEGLNTSLAAAAGEL